jgi:hypothetical protein
MTDPRIAALAAALQVVLYPGEDIDRDENLWIEQDTRRDAAAILAALAVAGWTLVPVERGVTNEPPPRLVEELYP